MSPGAPPLYRLEGVQHAYGGRIVLDIPGLTFPGSSLGVVVGPNGAGKSTLLRLLAFLEAPDRGRVWFKGEPAAARGADGLAWRRRVTLVSQRPVLFSRSVWDNVAYGLRVRGLAPAEVARRTEAAIAHLGLEPLARAYAPTLSGGEAQRVALARAWALRPEALILDEPTGNLDPASVVHIEEGVRALRRDGIDVIMVTHNLAQARRLAERLVVLIGGRVAAAGEAAAVLAGEGADAAARAFLAEGLP